MSAKVAGGFPARAGADRKAVLALLACAWIGILTGFGTDSYQHVSQFGLDYPPIVHFHAVTFVSFLLLFTTQVLLIRGGRQDLHRRLGKASVALICLMLVIGPATAITVHLASYAKDGSPPVFLAVQLTDMIGFGGLAFAGLALRNVPSAHKRLMLLALIYITDAGFGRFLNHFLSAPLGTAPLAAPVDLYFGSDMLALALGGYDLAKYRRFHPVYIPAMAWTLGLQALALYLLMSPGWVPVSLHFIGR